MSGEIPPAQPPPVPDPQQQHVRPVPWWRWRRNPLRRRTDQLQSWIALGLLLAVPLVGAAAMVVIGEAAYRHYRATSEHQAKSRHHTTAVLLHDAPQHLEPGSDEARATRYPAEVRYTDPTGRTRTGTTDVPPGLPADSTVRVWVGEEGTITEPPMTSQEVRSRSMGWSALALLAVAATGVTAYGATLLILRRRNFAAWDTQWAQTAPRWTGSP
ncbi:hypothetical protein KBZ21_15525 [Streptomyces sp. A73]|nr:hypothetical protein [Streptomyces sp. A73]